MTSPSESLRKHLSRRTSDHISLANKVTPDRLLKSPSQKKSERARQKELKRAGVENAHKLPPTQFDCWTCQKNCGLTVNQCQEKSFTFRCQKCGQKTMYRYDPDKPWVRCAVCRGEV